MEELIDKIEKYLRRELPPDEAADFEAQLADDPALREEVAAVRIARQVIEQDIEDQLRQDLAAIAAEAGQKPEEPAPRARTIPLGRRLAIAATVLLLIVGGAFWWLNRRGGDAEQLVAQFYEPENLSRQRALALAPGPLAEGVAAFENEDYEAAVEYFAAAPPGSDYYLDAQLYLANAYFQLNDQKAARSVLQPLTENPNPLLAEKAEWLLVLSYLKSGPAEKAEVNARLKAILSDPDHSYFPAAAELRAALDRLW